MALADCIARAGDALSADDRAFLEAQLADGATDDQALNSLESSVTASLGDVAQSVQAEGGQVATRLPPMAQAPRVLKQELTRYGFFSALQNTVETMNLPAWKKEVSVGWRVITPGTNFENRYATPEEAQQFITDHQEKGFSDTSTWSVVEVHETAQARGTDIWQKIQTSGGLKKDEVEFIGLEEMLLSDPDAKFSRQEVTNFITAHGVTYEESVADVSEEDARDSQTESVHFGDGEIDDESENWIHRVEDMMDEFRSNNVYWFDEGDQMTYIEENLQDELIEKYIEIQSPDTEAEIDAMRATLEAMSVDERMGFVSDDMDLLADMNSDLEAIAEEKAEEAAEQEYMENPYYRWSWSSDGGANGIDVWGNDDVGYRLSDWSGHEIGSDIYSFSEVEIQAQTYAQEEGWLFDEDNLDQEVARWENYGIEGDYTNYREVKIKLPSIPGRFMDPHFSSEGDENLVAFLRVTDRDMMLPLDAPVDPQTLAAYEAEVDAIPKLQDIDITKSEPPDELYMEQPRQSISAYYGEWKDLPEVQNQPTGRDGEETIGLKTQLLRNWEAGDMEKRAKWVTEGIKAKTRQLNQQFVMGNNMTEAELADGEDPTSPGLQRQLDEYWNDEAMEVMKDRTRTDIVKKLLDKLSDAEEAKKITGQDSIVSTQSLIEAVNEAEGLQGDWAHWDRLARVHNIDFQNSYRENLQKKNRLESEIERNNRMYNDIDSKRERAGKGKVGTLNLDEVQSGWHGSQGGGRELGYKSGVMGAGELDDLAVKIKTRIDTKLKEVWAENTQLHATLLPAEFAEISYGLIRSSPNKDFPLKTEVEDMDAFFRQANMERDGVPNVPFKGDGWLHMALKRAITMAVAGGYDAIAWGNNTRIQNRWSERYNYAPQYDQKMPSAVRKFTKIAPILVDDEGIAIKRVIEPKIDSSGWTVESSPEGPDPIAIGFENTKQIIGQSPSAKALVDFFGADLGINTTGMWHVVIPELDIDTNLHMDTTVVTPQQAMREAIKLYEKQVRMLEFYTLVPTTTTVMRDGKETETPSGLVHAIDEGRTVVTQSRNSIEGVTKDLADNFYTLHHPKEPEGNWIIPVTPELRESVEDKGFSFFQEERGRFSPKEYDNIIQLTKTSDLSTFLHESGHLFLETQKMWVRKYGLDDNQKAMLSWLGLNNFDEITTEHHERWAESFEVYLRNGQAPSLQLRQAFAAFSRWLKKIYRMLTDSRLRRADDGTEIAAIFDRMLATEEEIAEASANPEYDKYFKSKEQAGMNESQWKAYQKRAARVKNNAEMTVDEKIMAQYMKQKTAEWNAEKGPMIEEERQRLSKLPVYQILADVQGDRANNVPGVPFSTSALNAIYPDGIPKKLQFRQSKEGIDPAQYSEQYGYPSAKAMLDEIIKTPSLKEAASEAAQARMVDKHGDILTDGTLEAEVREALINEDQAELLLMELQASKKTGGINRQYLKAQAIKMIAGMTYGEIKPGRFYRTMVKAAQDAVRMENPTDAKIQQLSNHYLYREAVRVREQMEKHRRYVSSIKNRKFDTNKLDSEYAQRMKMLAEMYEMRQSPEQLAKLSDILNFFSAQVTEAKGDDQTDLTMLDPNLVAAIEYRTENNNTLAGFELVQFEDMTAEDLHGVVDMLRHLSHVGRQLATLNGSEAMRERMELTKSIGDEGGKNHPIQRSKVAVAKSMRIKWNYLVNTMPSLVNMTRKLDGMKAGGEAFKKIFIRISDANDRKLALNSKYYKRFEDMVGNVSRVKLSRMDSKNFMLESGEQINLSSEEVFMMALYWGTESSREAIRQGHAVTDNDVKGILGSMSKEQLHLVNTIWRMNETHWADLQRAAITMEGYAPPKLEATGFVVNGVEMEGGHMQLFYDSQRLELKNEQEVGTRRGSVMPTKAGSLNARVGSGGQPVNLDINNLTRSIDDKVHYVAFAEAGRDIRRLVNHPEVRDIIEQKHGSGFYEAYIGAIEAITTNRAHQESHKTVAAISKWARQSATMMHLMYSIRNTAQQWSALPIAMAEVGPQRFVWASIKLASEMQEMVKFIRERSKFMDNRAELVNRDSREAMRKVIATSKFGAAYQNLKAHGFMFQIFVDSTIAYPTWLAKYQKGMDEHGDEKRAQIEADSAVGESVGSGSDLQLGRIMQSNQSEITKTVTVFGSWFNAYYQRLYRSSKGGEDFINLKFGMDAVILPFLAANIAQALIMDMPDTGGEEDETWTEWAIKNQWIFMLGTIPIIREFASLSAGFTPSAPINTLPRSVDRVLKEFDALIDERQTPLKTGVDVGRAVASVAKAPGSGQLLRILEYIDSYLQGEESNFNPWQMLVEGADKDDR